MVLPYTVCMITKQSLLDNLGGTHSKVARKLGYVGNRADNNIIRLPDILTERQANVIIMRMKAKRIPVPKDWV